MQTLPSWIFVANWQLHSQESLLFLRVIIISIFFTFDGCRQWRGQDEAGTAEINNAEILDNDEGNNALLDVTIDDIDDDTAVGDDADKQDDNNDPALQWLGEQKHWTRRPDGL